MLVKNRESGKYALEKWAFTAFLNAKPEFAGEAIINWDQPVSDPPDVLCKTQTGRKIGVELTEWLDQAQIAQAMGLEHIQRSILEAISPQPPNNTEHIHLARLFLRPKMRVKTADATAFRAELQRLIEEVDIRWNAEPEWQSPVGCWWTDFSGYPVLGKYLSKVEFDSRRFARRWPSTRGSQSWLTFPCRGSAYSPDTMMTALQDRLKDKIQKYAIRPIGLKEFHLLVHYDKAWAYNSPAETPWFTFADAAQAGAAFIGDNPGVFNRIFLFVPQAAGKTVYQLYPRITSG